MNSLREVIGKTSLSLFPYTLTDCRCQRSNGRGVTDASLIPDFDFVAIRVGDVRVGIARAEFASPEQLAAGALHFVDGRINVARRNQTEAKVHDAERLRSEERRV